MYGFCVFSKYKVKIVCKGSSYIRTDWEGDSYYEDFDYTDECIIEGGELMEMFADHLTDKDCIEFGVKDGVWNFSYFEPHNGSGWDKTYTIEELKELE